MVRGDVRRGNRGCPRRWNIWLWIRGGVAKALQQPASVFETELVQEQLYRASVFYGRGGLAQCIISGIDIAMWDAKGKLLGHPVYNLLGGKTRELLPTYYTGNDPNALAEFQITDMKIAVPYGPAHGEEGMRKNEEAVAKAREKLGRDGFIALDIYMSWDVPYTVRMYERLHGYGISWLEEPVLPDDYAGYREIRRSIPTMVTGVNMNTPWKGFAGSSKVDASISFNPTFTERAAQRD